jgi:G3E family GTPase
MTAPRLTVIGGYLGAGKTTLVNRLLAGATGERVAVIVNDFGSINIDAELIRSADKDTVRLTNGCMCCSASDGLAAALARLCARADEIDRIVIETSGVSEPGKVAKNAHGFRLPLDAVIVMADAEQLPAQASNRYVGDVVRRQLAQADLILLNKIDLVGPEALARAREVILLNAPRSPVAETTAANLPLVLLFAGHGLRGRTDGNFDDLLAEPSAHHHETSYESWVVERGQPIPRAEFEAMANNLSAQAIRAKGHVQLAEGPDVRHLYQQVGRRWTLSEDGVWDVGTAGTRLVAIAIRDAPMAG